MAITGFNSDGTKQLNSYMQFDLGSVRSDITAVRMVGPMSTAYSTLPENVSVYLSATPDFKAGTLCDTGIAFTELSQLALIDCPAGTAAQYLTVLYNVPNQRLALMEVTPYYEGESAKDPCHVCGRRMRGRTGTRAACNVPCACLSLCPVTPCPPPPPPVFDPPECPVPAAVVNGSMYPWAMGNDTRRVGYQKAVDGRTWGTTTTAITGYKTSSSLLNSYMQFDLGVARTDIGQVRLVAPMYQTSAVLPNNLSVYVSADTNFRAGVLCASNITFATWLESLYMLCPITSTRYVTVVDNVPDRRLALQEVAALYDGGWKQGCMRQRHPLRAFCPRPLQTCKRTCADQSGRTALCSGRRYRRGFRRGGSQSRHVDAQGRDDLQ
jgi:hypothetical protein